MFLNLINFVWEKFKNRNAIEDAPQPQPLFLNNLNENPRIFTNTSFAVVSFISGLSSAPPIYLYKFKKIESIGEMLVAAIPFHITISLFFPIVVYIANDKLRTFVWNELVPNPVRNNVSNIFARVQVLLGKPPENDSGIELQSHE